MKQNKRPIILILSALIASLGSGCGSTAGDNAASMTNSLLPAAIGGVLGGVGGDAMFDSTSGAIGGAVVGMIAAAKTAEYLKQDSQQLISEAYEQGRREARVEASNEFWDDRTFADGSHPDITGEESTLRQIQYDARFTESVRYGSTYVSTDQAR
jgi:hypothetical protein